LLLGGAISLCGLVVFRALPAAAHAVASRLEFVRQRAEVLARAEEELGAPTSLADSAKALRDSVAQLASKILVGGREAEALTDLTGRLGVIAETHHVKMQRTVGAPDSVHAGPLRRVSLHASFEGDTQGTLGLLVALSRAPVLLDASELRMIAADPRSPAGAPEVLRSELTVRGWYLARDSAP
jgi:hypothetical protein